MALRVGMERCPAISRQWAPQICLPSEQCRTLNSPNPRIWAALLLPRSRTPGSGPGTLSRCAWCAAGQGLVGGQAARPRTGRPGPARVPSEARRGRRGPVATWCFGIQTRRIWHEQVCRHQVGKGRERSRSEPARGSGSLPQCRRPAVNSAQEGPERIDEG